MKIHTYIGATPKAKRRWIRWHQRGALWERGYETWKKWKKNRFRSH